MRSQKVGKRKAGVNELFKVAEEVGGDGEVRRLKAIIDAVNRIDSSLQTIAQA